MHELTYDIPGGIIATVLFVLTILAVEGGFRAGLKVADRTGESQLAHVRAVQGAVLGLMAILLGFTLSLALARFDTRSEAVVREANAMGTAYLRVGLLRADLQPAIYRHIRDYVDVRVESRQTSLADIKGRKYFAERAAMQQQELWNLARQAMKADPNPATSGLFAQAVNDAIDSAGSSEAALERHIPETVLWLLFASMLLAGGVVGYATGVSGHRPSLAGYCLAVLIVALVFVTLDLDRPRRGLIQVSQKPLLDLQADIHAQQNDNVHPTR